MGREFLLVKVKEGKLRSHIPKKFFTKRMARLRNKLPRETMNTPSLQMFKARFLGTLDNLL